MVPKNLDQAREKVHALVFDVPGLEHSLRLVIKEVVLINPEFAVVFVLQDHVAAHRDEQGIDALPDDLLNVRTLHQGGEQFNELQGHAADPMGLFDLIVLIGLEAPQL